MHHRRGLRRLLGDDALLAEIDKDPLSAALDERRLAMLAYASKLTLSPAEIREPDIELLRDQGLSDLDILNLVEVTAYYAYANRIADGLGVELEPPG